MDSPPVRYARSAAVAALLLFLLPGAVQAQYFGRNKVQYKDFDFQVLKTEHFDIYFYPSEREGVDIAARMAERWHARLERLLDHQLRGRQPLVLYASHPDFEQTNVHAGELGEGTGGVTESLRRRIVLPLGGPLADTDHVIGHELVHAFQFDITTAPGMRAGRDRRRRLPLWFIEGMAEYLSIGPVDSHTAMWLRDAARRGTAADHRRARQPEVLPVSLGPGVLGVRRRHVGRRRHQADAGRRRGGRRSRRWPSSACSASPRRSCRRTGTRRSGRPTHRSSERRLTARRPARRSSRGEKRGGDLNVGPAISPDGKLDRVSVRAELLLDRSVRRRRGDRQGRAQADEHGDRSALLEHAVHPFRRARGTREPAASRSRR